MIFWRILTMFLAINVSVSVAYAAKVHFQTDWSAGKIQQISTQNWTDTVEDIQDVNFSIPGQISLAAEVAQAIAPLNIIEGDSNNISPADILVLDLDLNGHDDVVYTAPTGSSSGAGFIYWLKYYPNEQAWQRIAITEKFIGAYDLASADVDNDGDVDIIVTAYYDENNDQGHFAWFENRLSDGQNFRQHLIASSQDYWGAQDVKTCDLDNDGDEDIVGASTLGDDLSVFVNNNNGTSWQAVNIKSDYQSVISVVCVDINGDGLNDLVSGGGIIGDNITWFENMSNFNFTEHENFGQTYPLSYFDAADVDGDGNMDIIATDNNSTGIVVFKNVNGDGTEWPYFNLGAQSQSQRNVLADDFDGDGDVDILGSNVATPYTRFTLFEQTQNQSQPWKKIELGIVGNSLNPTYSPAKIVVGDLNNDGKKDAVVGIKSNSVQVGYYEPTEFKTNGELTSLVLDGGPNARWEYIEWDAEIDENTDLLVEVRSSNNPFNMGVWSIVQNSGMPLKNLININARYFQYRITVNGVSASSPIFNEIRIKSRPFVNYEIINKQSINF